MSRQPTQFSVIIPTCRRPAQLARCLRALAALDYDRRRFEIIVVEDWASSADEQPAEVTAQPLARVLRMDRNRGPASARNAGAAVARGRYLAFLDDDCLASPEWLTRLESALEANPGSAVGGRILNARTANPYAEASQAILDSVYRYYNAQPAEARFFATMNLAVPADSFRQLGGFDPSFRTAEDRDFCARWLRHGRRLVYAGDAVVWHDSAPGWREFWRRHYRFGQGAYRFRRKHAVPPANRLPLEPAAFYRRLLLDPLRAGLSPRSLCLTGLILISQAASALGFGRAWLREVRRNRTRLEA